MYSENLIYLKALLEKTFAYPAMKVLSGVFLAVFQFCFNPSYHSIMMAILVLIVFDFITGVYASFITGQEIKSAKIFRTAIKVLVYFMMISASYLTEHSIQINLYLDEIMMATIALTELISIVENAGRCGYVVPQKMLNKLKSIRDEQ